MRKFWPLFILIIGCNGADLSGPSVPLPSFHNGNGNNPPGKWATLPVTVSVSQGMEDEHHLIETMGQEWNGANENINFMKLSDATTINIDTTIVEAFHFDNVVGVYKSNNWLSGVSSYALAVTYSSGIYINRGTPDEYVELEQADIIINYKNFDFDEDGFDLASVILHEMGHLIGLNHYDGFAFESVMAPALPPNLVNQTLYDIDKSSINQLYGLGIQESRSRPDIRSNERVTIIHEQLPFGNCHTRVLP